MLNEKIIYYRKKNMLTQEELAYQLNVSRQTITKWEAGIIYPNVEYLIKLSNLFDVSIDYLVKEDDCLTLETHKIEISELACFLVKAKKATYANKTNKVNSSRKESHDYSYQENNYTYLDSFFGAENFSGQEIVYKDGKPCWSMNYYGRVIEENFNGDFLKEALLQVDEELPFRGPLFYQKGVSLLVAYSRKN
ncbi:MAG: DUF5680 domain-containing protein [Faecalibacillus faecis]